MPLTKAPVSGGYNRRNYSDQVLADCPEAFFRFNEGSGTVAVDRSGFDRNGTYDAVTFLSTGLSGTGDPAAQNVKMRFSHPVSTKREFSFDGIISISGTSWSGIFFAIGTLFNGLHLGVGDDAIFYAGNRLQVNIPYGSSVNTNVTIASGRHHIGLSISIDNLLRVFLDGVLVYQGTHSYSTQAGLGSIGAIYNGTQPNNSPVGVTFDEFAFYGCELAKNRFYAHWKAAQLGL